MKTIFRCACVLSLLIGTSACGKGTSDVPAETKGSQESVSAHLAKINGRQLNTHHRPGGGAEDCQITAHADSSTKHITLAGEIGNDVNSCPYELAVGRSLTFDCTDDGKCDNSSDYGSKWGSSLTYKLVVTGENSMTLIENSKESDSKSVYTKEFHFY